MTQTKPPKDVALLAGIFAVSGTIHLVKPELYRPLIPSWVPAHHGVIVGSGVAELVCAAGLVAPATRRPAGLASAALLLAVYVGNLKMAADAMKTRNTAYKVVTLARLPLQVPMVRSALKAYRSA